MQEKEKRKKKKRVTMLSFKQKLNKCICRIVESED